MLATAHRQPPERLTDQSDKERRVMKHMRYVLAAALLLAGPSALPARAADTPLDDIKEAILRLP